MFMYLQMLGKGAVQKSKKFSIACCVLMESGSQSSGMLCHVDWCIGINPYPANVENMVSS